MYPYELFWGIDLYAICISIGVFFVMLVLRLGFDRLGIQSKWFNTCLIIAISAVVLGYGSAVLFQAFYNFMATGVFKVETNTGSTFYGGLIGGILTIFIMYFVIGHFMYKDNYHAKQFFNAISVGACCVTVCHGFGRIGCLMGGCCYGRETDAWYGIYMVTTGTKVVPTQLFEAIFLFALFGFLFWKVWQKKPQYNLSTYMIGYAVWRFVLEFFRDDDRGATIVPFLTPSQFIAVLMVVFGIALFFLERFLRRKGWIA